MHEAIQVYSVEEDESTKNSIIEKIGKMLPSFKVGKIYEMRFVK